MAMNIGKQITTTVCSHRTQQLAEVHRITLHEAVQSHFSVEGVQAYSPQEIAALKANAERSRQPQGTFAPIKHYQPLDQTISTSQIRPKSALKAKLYKTKEQAKEQSNPSQQGGLPKRSNPKAQIMKTQFYLTRLQKKNAQKTMLEQQLQKLTAKYKQHFGKQKKQDKHIENETKQQGQQQQQQQQFKMEEEEGDCAGAPQKDDDFEEVEWKGSLHQSKTDNLRDSIGKSCVQSKNEGKYKDKLGMALKGMFE